MPALTLVTNLLSVKTANYAATVSDGVVFANGNVTVTVFSANGIHGHPFSVKNIGNGAVNVVTSNSETIDATAFVSLSQYGTLSIISDGTNWLAFPPAVINANNSTYLNGQAASFYTNTSNLGTGTIPIGRVQDANTSVNGAITTAAQSFAGIKTFTANIAVNGDIILSGGSQSSIRTVSAGSADQVFKFYRWNGGSQFYPWRVGVSMTGSATGEEFAIENAVLTTTPGTETFVPKLVIKQSGEVLLANLLTLTSGQIAFPATANPSAGVNVLDDYEEGVWTPALTFDTPGDLNVAYSVQQGSYTKIGHLVRIDFFIMTSTFSHTTAAGTCHITGIPFMPGAVYYHFGAMQPNMAFPSTITDFFCRIDPSQQKIGFLGYIPGGGPVWLGVAHMTTGVSVSLLGSIVYRV